MLATIGSLLRHPVSIAGVLITTVGAVGFLTMAVAAVLGFFHHPYAGLIVFIVLPAVFVLGLLLIPLGIRLQRRAIRRDPTPQPTGPSWISEKQTVRRTVLAVDRVDRNQRHDRPARRVRRAALDGVAGVLRPDVPHADAPAIHGVAERGRIPTSHASTAMLARAGARW